MIIEYGSSPEDQSLANEARLSMRPDLVRELALLVEVTRNPARAAALMSAGMIMSIVDLAEPLAEVNGGEFTTEDKERLCFELNDAFSRCIAMMHDRHHGTVK